MSQQLISLSPDLKRLVDEGYDIEIRSNYLLIKSVPYVNSSRQIKLGTFVSTLNLGGNKTVKPDTHVAQFAGDYPCNQDGSPIEQIRHQSAEARLGPDLVIQHSFSSKPKDGYQDYYDKMTTYVAIVTTPAQVIDHNVTPRTYPVLTCKEDESVFRYMDTASSRAGINMVANKLELAKIAIVGLD